MQWTRAQAETATETGPIPFILSTPGEKRDGLELDQSLFRFDNFRRNPVMLWQHGRDLQRGSVPIGRWEGIRMVDGVMRAEAVFDETDEFATMIEGKYRRGYLNAASIGWMPTWDERGRVTGFDLLEASAVAVPADPDALATARTVDLEFLREVWDRTSIPQNSVSEAEISMRRAFAALHIRNLAH